MIKNSILHTEFVRIDKCKFPCPICGKKDWCLISKDGRTAICPRVKSARKYKNAGYLHDVKTAKRLNIPKPEERVYLSSAQVQAYVNSLGIPPAKLFKQHADHLGVSIADLEYIGTLYDGDSAVLVFPMYDGNHKLVGCRMRRRDGRKWALKGGREGLVLASVVDMRRPLIVTEGPTDAAAAVKAGLVNLVARSNCCCSGNHIQRLMRNNPNTPIIVLADPNEVGIDGAKTLAYQSACPTIVLAGPGDVRNYVTTPRTDLFQDVVRTLNGDATAWRIVYRNMRAIAAANKSEMTDRIIGNLKFCRDNKYARS